MFMKTFMESYWVVLSHLRHDPPDGEDAKTRIRKIVSFGNRMHRLKEIENREALSKVTYENALEFFTSRVLRRSDPSHGLEHYTAGIESALRCLKA